MAMRTITVLQPDFYKDFGCVAAACRNNCCRHHWRIIVNKAHYKKLRALKEPKWLTENFSKFVKRNPDSRGETDYAYLQQRPDGGCLFQTEDGLCRIHGELGADYLCTTCKIYPRHRALVLDSDVQERGLCSSCEEVVRLLLAHPAPLVFEQHTEELPSKISGTTYRDVSGLISAASNPLQAHYLAIQTILIALLQAREYSLDERMMLVTLLLDKLAALSESNQPDAVPETLNTFVAAVEGGLYDELLKQEFTLDTAQLFANYGWAYAFGYSDASNASPLLQRCERGLEKADYPTRMADCRDFFAGDRGHLIEHLLVTELWNKCLPFHATYTLRQNLYYFVSTYAVLRYFLSGWLAVTPAPTDTELLDCIAFFGKKVLHSNVNFEQNIELLRRNDMTTLPYLLAIIRG